MSIIQMFQMDEEEVYSVPSLGRHYSCHWAMEDMEEERREAGRALENMDTGNRPSARDWQKDSGLNTYSSHSQKDSGLNTYSSHSQKDSGLNTYSSHSQKNSGLNTYSSHSHVKLATQHTACNKVSRNLNVLVIMDPLYQCIDIALIEVFVQ